MHTVKTHPKQMESPNTLTPHQRDGNDQIQYDKIGLLEDEETVRQSPILQELERQRAEIRKRITKLRAIADELEPTYNIAGTMDELDPSIPWYMRSFHVLQMDMNSDLQPEDMAYQVLARASHDKCQYYRNLLNIVDRKRGDKMVPPVPVHQADHRGQNDASTARRSRRSYMDFLEALRYEESLLAQRRLEIEYEKTRGAVGRWWEIKDSRFSQEIRRVNRDQFSGIGYDKTRYITRSGRSLRGNNAPSDLNTRYSYG